MKRNKSVVFVFLTLYFLLPNNTHVQADESILGLTVYRTADGELAPQSIQQGEQMWEHANQNGYITLWITLNYPYNTDLDSMSDEEQQQQTDQVRNAFEIFLHPYVQNGSIWHPSTGPRIIGPGSTVRATKKGVNKLLKERGIIQIVQILEE